MARRDQAAWGRIGGLTTSARYGGEAYPGPDGLVGVRSLIVDEGNGGRATTAGSVLFAIV